MADRFPIIIESTEQQIQELSAGDGLDLTRSGVVNANYVHSAEQCWCSNSNFIYW